MCEIPAGAAVRLGIRWKRQQITSGEDSKRPARSNLWVCWCSAFEQQRFCEWGATQRLDIHLMCIRVWKTSTGQNEVLQEKRGKLSPPDEVRQRAVRRRGSSARSGEAKQKSGEMRRLQNRRSEKGGVGVDHTVGMFLHLYIGLDDVEKVWCIVTPKKCCFWVV